MLSLGSSALAGPAMLHLLAQFVFHSAFNLGFSLFNACLTVLTQFKRDAKSGLVLGMFGVFDGAAPAFLSASRRTVEDPKPLCLHPQAPGTLSEASLLLHLMVQPKGGPDAWAKHPVKYAMCRAWRSQCC